MKLADVPWTATATNLTETTFYEGVGRYYEEKFRRFPTLASEAGFHEFDDQLGHATVDSFRQEAAAVETLSAEVQALPEYQFGPQAWLDRRCLLAQLRSDRLNLCRLKTWRRNPNRHASVAVDSLLSLVVRHADDMGSVANAVESRLAAIPRYLDGAAAAVNKPVPLWAELAVQTCQSVPEFLEALAGQLPARDADHRQRLDGLIADAKRAFARYAKAVSRQTDGNPYGYQLGRKRFERLLAERLGMTITADEALAMGQALADELGRQMTQEARRFSPHKLPSEILEEARAQWRPSAPSLTAEYQAITGVVRDRFAAAEAVSFPPGESLLVKAVPAFLAHEIPTAAYLAPGPFDDQQVGVFWVNDPANRTDVDPARETAQHFGMALTCGHEAYPGHHLQFCSANRHPSPLRRLFAHAIYYEGWTLWCEQMFVDLGIEEANPYARLQQLHDAYWRANRILIDVGLHTETLDHESAARLLVERVGFSPARAAAELNWYTQSPTVPMSYLLGKYENLRLRAKYMDRGGWSLRKFNDWLLSWGTVPQRWIELSA